MGNAFAGAAEAAAELLTTPAGTLKGKKTDFFPAKYIKTGSA
jgi:hypothetical protein